MNAEERPLLRLRVSHDSGRTWGPVREVTAREANAPMYSSAFPPCRCQRCMKGRLMDGGGAL